MVQDIIAGTGHYGWCRTLWQGIKAGARQHVSASCEGKELTFDADCGCRTKKKKKRCAYLQAMMVQDNKSAVSQNSGTEQCHRTVPQNSIT